MKTAHRRYREYLAGVKAETADRALAILGIFAEAQKRRGGYSGPTDDGELFQIYMRAIEDGR